MKIGIFTPYSLNPIHPRTEMYLSYFKELQYNTELLNVKKSPRPVLTFLSKVFINMFDFQAVFELRKIIGNYDQILIQDLRYLLLAIPAKRSGKKVIYETLDNSVYIRVHNQHNHLLYPLIRLLIPFFSFIEKIVCRLFTDVIIVNSTTLKKRFGGKSHLIYYSSPFESEGITNNPANKPSFLYLGAISYDKGITEIFSLIAKYRIPCCFFGDCSDEEIRSRLESDPLISWGKRIDSSHLRDKLLELTKNYFLIGLSLIKPVHFSYATQEANKEIDYLAMGIPFIGNHRLTTSEKIRAGCGVFLDNSEAIYLLIEQPEDRLKKSLACRQFYAATYSMNQFYSGVSSIFNK
jgi:hypothetical protein